MDCNFPDVTGGRSTVVGTNSSLAANARNQAVDLFRGGYNCHFSQIQLSLAAADLIHRDRNRGITCLVEEVSSIPRVLISKLQPHPPLLPLTNTDSHSIVQNLQKLELGKLVFTLALTAILGLLYSQKLEENKASSPHYLIIVGFMVLTSVIWNGISFGAIYPCLGNILQLLGITLVLCLLCVLVGTFLPASFSSACWLSAVLYLLPFLYLIIKPHPQTYLQRFQA